jgi:hypothetical protein
MTDARASDDELLTLARELAARLLGKHGEAGVLAVGVHGPAAHGERGQGLDLAVVTTGPEADVPERVLRHRGVVVDLGVITAEDYLAEAAQVGPAWPLAVDQYRSMVPVYDPSGFFAKLRGTHEEAVAKAPEGAFFAAAGWNLAQALAQQAKAERAEAQGDPAGALFAVREGALLAALTLGLLGRAAYRDPRHALASASAAPMPPGFAETFRLAIDPDSDAHLAVAALGEALGALTELARRDGLPFEAVELDDFL